MKAILVPIALVFLVVGCGGGNDDSSADAAGTTEAHEAAPHWGYAADNGPSNWAQMNDEWATCASGSSQSPIDLGGGISGDVPAAAMNFPPVQLHIAHQEHVLDALDNGHTIQVNYDGGETLNFGDESFKLLQYHFHSPSEHTVNGEHYPMEMHLVHKSDAGNLAVIGVFIEEGAHHAGFDAIWSNLPQTKGDSVHVEGVQTDIDSLLPAGSTSYRYHGSLTTPPCSESVRWMVMTDPIQLDSDQINAFREVFTGNNRPTQALNDREVLTDRTGS